MLHSSEAETCRLRLYIPSLACGDQILAVPALVRRLPTSIKTIIGDPPSATESWAGSISVHGK